jgi:hypothetical protein
VWGLLQPALLRDRVKHAEGLGKCFIDIKPPYNMDEETVTTNGKKVRRSGRTMR